MLLATAINTGATKWNWVVAKDLCAGIIGDCQNADECTTTAVGPCEGGETSPKAYLKSRFVGIAFVNLEKYLACADPNSCNDMKVLQPSGLGYRDYSGAKTTPNGGKYAYVMSGNTFGTNSADVYAGVASYINTGDKNIETSTNVVYGAGTTTAARVSRGDSTIGAPNGPYEVCITDTSATSGVCAKNATFEPGALKFSIFGRTLVSGSGSIPADSNLDYFGVRMELQAVGFDVNEVLVGTYDTLFHKLSEFDINSQEAEGVKSLTLTHASGGIKIEFIGWYNFGTINHDGSFRVDGRKQVKVRISRVAGEKQSIYIDYLFHQNPDFTMDNKYFMYDPTIAEVKSKEGNVSNAPAAAISLYLMIGSVAVILWNSL